MRSLGGHKRFLNRVAKAACTGFAAGVLLAAYAAASLAEAPYAVPRKTIYPGETLQIEMLSSAQHSGRSDPYGQPYATIDEAVGQVTRMTLLPGQPIRRNALRAQYVVLSGKLVTIRYSSGDLDISARAMAMQNGSPGDVVAVQNIDSNAVLRGTVRADGIVEIGD
ncbi:MAG: flagellar basal body P-ring formation protein FlgA [Proteobacteria bacterium]|nr:flagellar basal body P-ring formation protein FlgA [Pseudomonadota bacterium]